METKRYTKEELEAILLKHKKWLNRKEGGEKADLSGADLSGAKLDHTESYRLGMILDKPMIGYKKCSNGEIVKLRIPKGAVVFCINGSKCRTNIAKVLEISGNQNTAVSEYDPSFVYEIGKTIEVKNFDMMYNEECASGIHFFKTKEEAENY